MWSVSAVRSSVPNATFTARTVPRRPRDASRRHDAGPTVDGGDPLEAAGFIERDVRGVAGVRAHRGGLQVPLAHAPERFAVRHPPEAATPEPGSSTDRLELSRTRLRVGPRHRVRDDPAVV